jgi:hypothetical protein
MSHPGDAGFYARAVVPEAPLEPTEHGLVPGGDGWFVLNARETRWFDRKGRGVAGDFDGGPEFPFAFPQLGIGVYVLGPGEPMAMYHWEAGRPKHTQPFPCTLARVREGMVRRGTESGRLKCFGEGT